MAQEARKNSGFRLRRWAVWSLIYRDDQLVSAKPRSRWFTHRGAEREARRLECDPGILSRTIESWATGHPIRCECEVRPA
jgi:hypothetical protein